MAEHNNTTPVYDKRIVRVRRVIEYLGEASWIAATLARSFALPRPFRSGGGGIQEIERRVLEGPEGVASALTRATRPPLVYIAGKFGADTPEQHQINVQVAAEYRWLVAGQGCYPVCPHTNTRDMGGETGKDLDPEVQEFWYEGSIELLRRCDAMLMIPGWQDSTGAKREKTVAEGWGIPVLHAIDPRDTKELNAWVHSLEPAR